MLLTMISSRASYNGTRTPARCKNTDEQGIVPPGSWVPIWLDEEDNHFAQQTRLGKTIVVTYADPTVLPNLRVERTRHWRVSDGPTGRIMTQLTDCEL